MADEERKKKNAERQRRWRERHPPTEEDLKRAAERAAKRRLENPERVAESNRRYYQKHREDILEYQKQYNAEHPEKNIEWIKNHPDNVKNNRLKSHYGIDLDWYNETLSKQGNGCAICGTKEPGGAATNGYFHVDHDHETGKPRGLLCHACNTSLGGFKESTDLLQKAIDYLKSFLICSGSSAVRTPHL